MDRSAKGKYSIPIVPVHRYTDYATTGKSRMGPVYLKYVTNYVSIQQPGARHNTKKNTAHTHVRAKL
ncbi:hypothetical protein DFH06DRAFT_1346724 [Mycena polygramma]|nr:hypothetical protein DFH06DRAFT_1346796 [Mycena polygramma]KAJ7608890.1 hypothetical protein DFH06DRAFT_1346724 [Mycena polygramma]